LSVLEQWTLTVVRELSLHACQLPVLELRFTDEARRLYALVSTSELLGWQLPSLFVAERQQQPQQQKGGDGGGGRDRGGRRQQQQQAKAETTHQSAEVIVASGIPSFKILNPY
jgi:hypothetical protein